MTHCQGTQNIQAQRLKEDSGPASSVCDANIYGGPKVQHDQQAPGLRVNT